MRVRFVGSSGSGKTTLAEYFSEKYGLTKLPSAARMVAEEMGVTDWDKLFADPDLADRFQKATWEKQRWMESQYERRGFVSDRAFDHLCYNCEIGLSPSQIFSSDGWQDYMAGLSAEDSLVFFVRPQKDILQAARDGSRDRFLDEGMVNRIDGAIQFILESHAVPYFPVEGLSMRGRVRLVDGVIGLYRRWGNKVRESMAERGFPSQEAINSFAEMDRASSAMLKKLDQEIMSAATENFPNGILPTGIFTRPPGVEAVKNDAP